MRSNRTFLRALLLLFLILVAGVSYFHFRHHLDFVQALYYVIITISTVGFEAPPVDLGSEGRLVLIGLIGLGVGTAAYSFSLAVSHIVEGELANILELRRMQKQIQNLKGHIIVCGIGRIGKMIAKELREHGKQVVCLDRDEEVLAELRREGYLTLQGDATEEPLLNQAGIERAEVLVSAMPTDAESVFLTLTARFLNRKLQIVARGTDEGAERKLRRAGANVVILPTLIGGRRMAQAVLLPNVMDFIDLTTGKGAHALRLDEIKIPPCSSYDGVPLSKTDLRSRYGLIIVAIRKPDGVMRFNPSSETTLESGDILVALGESSHLEELRETLPGQC
ncbi:MAG TPA: potassium channel protein [Planctomycetes bacterium]|nr:potassium channel protein [Planctomycetota bacterium]